MDAPLPNLLQKAEFFLKSESSTAWMGLRYVAWRHFTEVCYFGAQVWIHTGHENNVDFIVDNRNAKYNFNLT
jgi:hypothetical protein